MKHPSGGIRGASLRGWSSGLSEAGGVYLGGGTGHCSLTEVGIIFREDGDVIRLSFLPHMHLRGKAIEIEMEYPDGRSELILSVPNYDFNWQHTYEFREPSLIPEGSDNEHPSEEPDGRGAHHQH